MEHDRHITRTTRWTRRQAVLALLAMPVAAAAHQGQDAARIFADAVVIARDNNRLEVGLRVRNLGASDLWLRLAAADGAPPVRFDPGLLTPVDEARDTIISLEFPAGVPGVFTTQLDFGAAGSGPVIVMP